jgi:membrane-associated protease RseP (regulator of RpoE activity)
MSRFILGAAGAVAGAALLLAPAQQAAAQVSADEHGVSVGSPHETPAETTNQQGNAANQQPQRGGEQGYQEQAPNDFNSQQRSDGQQAQQQQQSNRDQSNRDEANERSRDRNQNRGGERDWRSDIRFGERTSDGLTISSVEEGSRYYQSGLRDGDVIISYNGQPLRNEDEFGRWANQRSRQRVPVIVLRDGERETVYIQYQGDGQFRDGRDQERSYVDNAGSMQSQAYLGVRFEMRLRNGAVISAIVPDSPADHAGLEAGDEIVAINGRQVSSPREVTRAVASMQPGDKIDIEFARRAEQQTQAVLEEHPRNVASAGYQEGDRNWQDRNIEQSGYDEQTGADDSQPQTRGGDQYRERTGERRGGGLLQRLRN